MGNGFWKRDFFQKPKYKGHHVCKHELTLSALGLLYIQQRESLPEKTLNLLNSKWLYTSRSLKIYHSIEKNERNLFHVTKVCI